MGTGLPVVCSPRGHAKEWQASKQARTPAGGATAGPATAGRVGGHAADRGAGTATGAPAGPVAAAGTSAAPGCAAAGASTSASPRPWPAVGLLWVLVAIGTLDFEGMIAGKALYAGAFTIDQALGGLGAGLRPLLPGFVVTEPGSVIRRSAGRRERCPPCS